MTRAQLEEVREFLEKATVELDQRMSQADSTDSRNLTGDEFFDARHQRYATRQLSYAIYNVNCDLYTLLKLNGTQRELLDELLATED